MRNWLRAALILALTALWVGQSQTALAYAGNYTIRFDGLDDHLICDKCGNTLGSRDLLTVEAWINWNGQWDNTVNSQGGIIGKQGTFGLRVVNGPSIQFVFEDQEANEANGSGLVVLNSSTVLAANTWYHVAATYKKTGATTGAAKIYLNGAGVAQLSTTGSDGLIDDETNKDIEMGIWQNTSRLFPGKIDEARVSNKLRYKKNFTPPTAAFNTDSNTLALYHFDENTGTSALDSSGHNNTLVFQNNPRWVDATDNTALVTPPANLLPAPVTFIKPDWSGSEPDWADFGADSYTLYWKDQDTDDNATITLFYDNDQNSGNGNLGVIETGIPEDAEEGRFDYVWNTGEIPEGSYVWDTSQVPNGEYYVGATISDEAGGVTSYSNGKLWVYHFPKVSGRYSQAGLASVWSDEPYPENPELVDRVAYFYWDWLEPCGDDNYAWKINPANARYYEDADMDGVCENSEGATYDWFKDRFMERLYEKVDPGCQVDCEFKQPLELIDPRARVYLQINGMGPNTLRYSDASGKYVKGPYWLFGEVALLRTLDGDYNANGRKYPSVQFWDPDYKTRYQDLLKDFATALKQYPEIYPYVSLVLGQFNAFNFETGFSAGGDEGNLCADFATVDECVDYMFDYRNYDSATRYNAGLAKTYYLDERNQEFYYYGEGNDYHEWVARTHFDIFKNDPDGKLHAEIVVKPYPTDKYFTPDVVYDAFGYGMLYEHGVWFLQNGTMATGYGMDRDLMLFVHDQKIARGHTSPANAYSDQSDPQNIIPARYDNPLQWVYWHTLMDLHRGIDVTSFQDNVVAKCLPGVDEEYCGTFEFLNQYAGQYFSPADSPGAWIAFRPLFHPDYLGGNYEMHLAQLDPDNTSIRLFGYDSCEGDADCTPHTDLNPPKPDDWDCAVEECPDDPNFGDARNGRVVNLGPKSQPYGIWARSIGLEGKNTITLDLDDQFVNSLCLAQEVRINVIYLDRGTDTFSLKYKNLLGLDQTVRVTKRNTGTWKGDLDSEAVSLLDYSFNDALNGGDLQLLSNSNGEDIFHMVKVEKVDGGICTP